MTILISIHLVNAGTRYAQMVFYIGVCQMHLANVSGGKQPNHANNKYLKLNDELMKKIYFVLCFAVLFITLPAFSQTHTETFPTGGKSFTIRCEPKDDGAIKVTIKNGITDTVLIEYKIYTADMETFALVFQQNFKDSCGLPDSVKITEVEKWKAYGRQLLKNYQTSLQNTLPKAGVIKLNPSLKMLMFYTTDNKRIDSAITTELYKVSRLQAEVSDGYLENIIAYITGDKDKILKFTLQYPIGMSSVDNLKKYADRQLYQMDYSPYKKPTKGKPTFFLRLGDLIEYDPQMAVQRRDYSPKDTVLDMQGGTSVTLHKEETNKLFEAHIYSDFKGFNEDKPNGILQFELSKRININTVQHASTSWLYWLFGSYGLSQYISPSVTLSKIEQHNRKLNLLDLDSVRLNPGNTDISQFEKQYHRYANALNLYQYQWLSVGTDLNLFFINNQARKFHVYFNTGIRFGLTDVVDSLTTVSNTSIVKTKFIKDISVTTFQIYPEIKVKFLPEERFNFSISNKWVYMKPLSQAFQMISYQGDDFSKISPKNSAWLNISEMHMTVQVNPRSKVFGRFRMNWEMGNIRNNFSQLQVGYSTYILGNK